MYHLYHKILLKHFGTAFLIMAGLLICSSKVSGQFAPPAGQEGTTAIHKDSTVFVGWATGCEVERGYVNIDNPELGYVSAGSCEKTTGIPGAQGSLSLGDGGHVILTFDTPIANGQGWDFAVFENAFDDYFLEPGFVAVSSDGENFFRFPNTSLTQTDTQIGPFGSVEATEIHNLAGKYRVLYGTPFDLDTLKNTPGLDINRVTHVKITDVVGSIQPDYARHDSHGNVINCPWPTSYPTGGFDLTGVGVINTANQEEKLKATVIPNPATRNGRISIYAPETGNLELRIFDRKGNQQYSATLQVNEKGAHLHVDLNQIPLNEGIHIIHLRLGTMSYGNKFIFLKQ
ncbi:MAG: hypothetical protein R6U62_09480 [Bacteroidales bacterium]